MAPWACAALSGSLRPWCLRNNLFAVYLGNSSRPFARFQTSCSKPTNQPPPPLLKKKKKLGSTRITWVVPLRSENTEIRIYTEKSHPWLILFSNNLFSYRAATFGKTKLYCKYILYTAFAILCDPLCEIQAKVSKSNYEITSIKVWF